MSSTGWNCITLENEVVYSEGFLTRVGATRGAHETSSKITLIKQILKMHNTCLQAKETDLKVQQ
jgi:hypothetical protein